MFGRGQMRTLCLLALSAVYAAAQTSGWNYSYIYNFQGGASGAAPFGLVLGPNGTVYGYLGIGSSGCCNGGIFQLSPPSTPGGVWTETVLYEFEGGNDGSFPVGSPVIGPNGSIYGATRTGGLSTSQCVGCGTVFQLTPPAAPGGQWTETVLYRFQGPPDADFPDTALAIGTDGSLYGTTYEGGSKSPPVNGNGTVYQVSPPSARGTNWKETVIRSFSQSGRAGANPTAGVAVGAGGVLYGSTTDGYSVGSIFSLTPPAAPGAVWKIELIRNFSTTGTMAIGPDGKVYGISGNAGTEFAFQLTPPASPGGNWTEVILHKFAPGPDGWDIVSSPVLDGNGNVYCTTTMGGASQSGVIFQLVPPANLGGSWTENLLYSFAKNDGGGQVILAPNGGLYGTSSFGVYNQGAVYELRPPSTPQF